MEAAGAARAGRRENLTLRPLAPLRARRKNKLDAAFEGFYRRHVAAVYQYALAVLANPADAEDVTQQTFLNAYRAFQRGEQPRKPHNWVIKIAHNVCRMRWRQSGRRPQEVPLELVREPVALEGDNPSLDEVLAALARLPFNQRSAIVMREVEDRSYAEIADVLGTTVPAVEALLFRARANLRARRKALASALSIAPVPASLSSFVGGSGGLVAGGGAVVGSEVALKVAAIVTAGVVAGGIGFKTAEAVGTAALAPASASAGVAQRPGPAPVFVNPLRRLELSAQPSQGLAGFSHPGSALRGRGPLQSAPTRDRASQVGAAGAAGGATPSGSESSSAASASSAAAETVDQVVGSVPGVTAPAIPTTPSTPAIPTTPLPPPPSLPPVPTVTVTVPTVTVTVPTLPPPPPLP